MKKAGLQAVHATGSTCRRGSGGRATSTLERAEAPTGTLLVNSDAGGEVYVDGQRKDAAPAIISGLPAGDHVVEVQEGRAAALAPDGDRPGRPAGQGRRQRSAPRRNSSLRIISNEPDVEVFVDGEPKGKAPVTIQAIKPGEHIVGGRKTRFKPVEQTVRVARGRKRHRQLPHGGGAARPAARDAEGAVAGPQRRGVPGRLQPGARAGRSQRPRPRQALHRRPQGRLHRLQARDHPAREPGDHAGRRPVGHRAACASCRARRGPR